MPKFKDIQIGTKLLWRGSGDWGDWPDFIVVPGGLKVIRAAIYYELYSFHKEDPEAIMCEYSDHWDIISPKEHCFDDIYLRLKCN